MRNNNRYCLLELLIDKDNSAATNIFNTGHQIVLYSAGLELKLEIMKKFKELKVSESAKTSTEMEMYK